MTRALQKVPDLVRASRSDDPPLALSILPLSPPHALEQAALASLSRFRTRRRPARRADCHAATLPRGWRGPRMTRTYVEHHPVLSQVLARDGWPCWYCGGGYSGDGSRDPWGASIEHLVPLSAGGAKHDPDNIRLAHRRCNDMAGDENLATKQALRDALLAAGPRADLRPQQMVDLGLAWGRRQNRALLKASRRERVKAWQESRRRQTIGGLYQPMATLSEIVNGGFEKEIANDGLER